MESGDVIEVDATAMAHGGVCVARHDGRVVFVQDTMPGERVAVRITDVRSRFARAETLEVIHAAADRRPHVWRQADVSVPPERRPGGADYGHIALSRQRELKAEVIRDALSRFAGGEAEVSVAPAGEPGDESADGTGWRTRIGRHVDREGRIGPFAARSHTVIPVDEHPLATAEVAEAALALRGERLGRVDLVQAADGAVRVLRRPDRARRPDLARRPDRGRRTAHTVVTERAGERDFLVDADGFWQVHRLAAATLDRRVRAALRTVTGQDGWHMDLYGGVGLFAAALAEVAGGRVTTVESSARATSHAAANLRGLSGVDAVTARVDRFLARLAATASAADRAAIARGVMVVDPPRSGAGRGVVEAIAALGPAAVVYVACDPVALARDVGDLARLGYRTTRIDGVDLFPNSHHVECVSVLRRDGVASAAQH